MEKLHIKDVSQFSDSQDPQDNQEGKTAEEWAVWEAFKNGDTATFEKMYKFYGNRIYHVCKKFHLSNEDAEEVVQDTFLKIWNNIKKLDISSSPNAYIFTIAKSIILNNIRKNATVAAYKNYLISKPGNYNMDTEDQVIFMDLQNNLQKLLDDLPPQRKSIFILSKFHELSNEEIAQKLNLSKRTVENQLYRVLKTLKENLKSFKIHCLLLMLSIF